MSHAASQLLPMLRKAQLRRGFSAFCARSSPSRPVLSDACVRPLHGLGAPYFQAPDLHDRSR